MITYRNIKWTQRTKYFDLIAINSNFFGAFSYGCELDIYISWIHSTTG